MDHGIGWYINSKKHYKALRGKDDGDEWCKTILQQEDFNNSDRVELIGCNQNDLETLSENMSVRVKSLILIKCNNVSDLPPLEGFRSCLEIRLEAS